MNAPTASHALVVAAALSAMPIKAPAAVVLGGTALLIDQPQAIDAGTLTFLPSGFGNTGTLLFGNSMSLPNAVSIASGAIANLQTFGFDVELSGAIAGAGALSKQLPGKLTLSGVNTYTGGTTVSGGSLRVTNGSALGSGTLNIEGAALQGTASLLLGNRVAIRGQSTIAAARNTTLTIDGLSSVATGTRLQFGASGADGIVELRHRGVLDVGELNSIAAQVVAGTLRLGTDPVASALARIGVQQDATLDLAGHSLVSFMLGGEGRITSSVGSGLLAVAGGEFAGSIDGDLHFVAAAGSTRLTGALEYTGSTTIDAGATLEISDRFDLPGDVVNNGVLRINDSQFNIHDSLISGSGKLIKLGEGFVLLRGASTFSGGLDVNGGGVVLTRGALPGTGPISIFDAVFATQYDLTLTNALVLGETATIAAETGTTLTWNPATLSASSFGSRLQFGSRGLAGNIVFDLVEGDLAGINVVAGTLRNIGRSPRPTPEVIPELTIAAGASVDLGGQSMRITQLGGAGRLHNTGPAAILEFGAADFSGRIEGALALKVQAGLATLRGINTYDGGTFIDVTSVLALAAGGRIGGDMEVVGKLIQDAGTTLALDDLTVTATVFGEQAQVFQLGGTTTVAGAFTFGTQGKALYVLQDGRLELRADNVQAGAETQFDWRGGRLRFTDDYTLNTGSALLASTQALDTTRSLQARNLTLGTNASVSFEGAALVADEQLVNAGRLAGTGTLVAATIENASELSFNAGQSTVQGNVDNLASGDISLASGGTLSFEGDVINNGTLHLEGGASAVFKGRVSGAGAFTGAGKSAYEAEFHVGNSPARVVLAGKQIFTSTSTIDMDLAGASGPGNCADCYAQLVFDGPVEIDGATLNINLTDGYTPRGGERYTLFVFNAPLTGGFGDVRLPKLFGGLQWDTSALTTLGELRVSSVPLPAALWVFLPAIAALSARRKYYS